MCLQIFPYHLGEYICRILRVTPFKYYKDILASNMRDDAPYDAIPNFTAADALKVVGVGRNEYIDIMQRAKSKKLLWRVNKGLVRDFLPDLPKQLNPAPWWRVCVVNLGEVEYRTMSQAEAHACRLAANYADGVPYKLVDPSAVASLYVRGLVWFHVPIQPSDHISIPPLEGFVSNKTSNLSSVDGIDPLETLLYHIFVAASERVSVSELADILNISMEQLKMGISMACRLGFCNKLSASDEAASGNYSPVSLDAPSAEFSELSDLVLSSPGNPTSPTSEKKYTKSVAFVVDSAVTGFLMMGALTPEVKKHSVTLFEGGRVYGTSVISELVEGLRSSLEISKDFEGEMVDLASTTMSIAAVLECLQSQGRPIELLRKESMESLPVSRAERILSHSYDILISATGLAGPALPVSDPGPTHFGPMAIALTPWINIAMYQYCGTGPASLILPCGSRMSSLEDVIDSDASHVLVWRWNPIETQIRAQDPLVLRSTCALFSLNTLLTKTAIMVQPIQLDKSEDLDSIVAHVPLPLRALDSQEEDGSMMVNAFHFEDPTVRRIPVDIKLVQTLQEMGLSNSIGCLKLLLNNGTWIPLVAQLGMPLFPVPLCQSVCENLSKSEFLSHDACENQKKCHAILQDILYGVAENNIGSQQSDFFPTQPLHVDNSGRMTCIDIKLH